MKNSILSTFILFIFCSLHSHAKTKVDTIYAADLQPIGRTLINNQHNLALITSGAHFGFSFKGNECAIYVSIADAGGHNYLQYELDGIYQKRIRVDGNLKEPIIIKTNSIGSHRIWIYKATEATSGALLFSKVAGEGVKSLSAPKLPLIEFIGNSITCGAAADDSEIPCGTGDYQDHHNAYMAYGPRVARALNVNFILSSVSGIGVYRTWNRDSPSMPLVYENANFQEKDSLKWDFKTYQPKIISIALGTNDMSNGDGSARAPFDTVRFVNDYVKFVQLVKSKYPKAQIALLSSPMIKGNSREILQRCLSRIKATADTTYPKDRPVATFFFEPMEAHGCSGHPSVADHQILAEELKPFFAGLLKQ
ncbi:SGNH/GDSL hydrolase family protein [Mucilaginibacter rubeus]|uniref:SGNH/GDSL hydrolase family protein n=1 Tax=Mucilaginibacter rubeus TaxID=2027860 RepID=A0A5C1HYI5_9SPHI|nr:SGNH/GDSL hydrolase family protein [Mucilaginibacter rubeus]QEM10864.1 SGNH/GDSL hydrolase family protein [Mucilaginibacter rubeus]